jgi:hypothetical protein
MKVEYKQQLQLDGIFTFSDNVIELELGDTVILKINNSTISKEAVAAFAQKNGKKLGYVPYKKEQINMNAKYKVTKILLNKINPQVLIAIEYEPVNHIIIQPRTNSNKLLKIDSELRQEINSFKKFLQVSGYKVLNIGITFMDENYIDLLVQTETETTTFYTVTREYYEKNIFLYEELFYRKMIPYALYKKWMIHRPEEYIYKNYKNITSLIRKYKNYSFDKTQEKVEKIDLNNYKICGLAFNHDMKAWSEIGYINDDSILEIMDGLVNLNKIEGLLYLKLLLVKLNKVIVYQPDIKLKTEFLINNNV